MKTVVTFGEIMMRLNPVGFRRFVQADTFEATYAGGEANVAVSLANYSHAVRFVSRVPAHEIGQCAVNELRKHGVDTQYILRGGARLGVYYAERGASQRGSRVIYDRAQSAIAVATPDMFDWDALLDGVQWFHFTGITPALSGYLPEITEDALRACKQKGIVVSCDLNYRAKLWTSEQANEVMSRLMPYVDVLIANEEDAKDVFGIAAADTDVQSGQLNHAAYADVAAQLAARFGIAQVAITLRTSISASENGWAGMLYRDGKAHYSREYLIKIVDRIGGGDSFGGGLIHALLQDMDAQEAIEFAVAASCLKQTIEHDFNLVSQEEVRKLMDGNASGRVQR